MVRGSPAVGLRVGLRESSALGVGVGGVRGALGELGCGVLGASLCSRTSRLQAGCAPEPATRGEVGRGAGLDVVGRFHASSRFWFAYSNDAPELVAVVVRAQTVLPLPLLLVESWLWRSRLRWRLSAS